MSSIYEGEGWEYTCYMKEFEQKIRTYLEERGWNNLRPSDVAKSIMIEGAELLEVFQWDNQTPAEVRADAAKMEHLRKELADVMIYCFDMAVLLDIDVEEILNAKLQKAQEKYPAELFNKEKNANDPGTEDVYKSIKQSYRREGKN